MDEYSFRFISRGFDGALAERLNLSVAFSDWLIKNNLDRGFNVFAKENTDSVFFVVRQKRFIWREDENGLAHPVNYDVFNRPRRQEFAGHLIENGAFFITSKISEQIICGDHLIINIIESDTTANNQQF